MGDFKLEMNEARANEPNERTSECSRLFDNFSTIKALVIGSAKTIGQNTNNVPEVFASKCSEKSIAKEFGENDDDIVLPANLSPSVNLAEGHADNLDVKCNFTSGYRIFFLLFFFLVFIFFGVVIFAERKNKNDDNQVMPKKNQENKDQENKDQENKDRTLKPRPIGELASFKKKLEGHDSYNEYMSEMTSYYSESEKNWRLSRRRRRNTS